MKSNRVSNKLNLHDAAHRISAFIYGNILILAALIVMSPEQVENGHALVIVSGTGLTTYLAHCIAEQQEIHVLHGRGVDFDVLKHAFRNAVPVLSSTAIPVAMLALGYFEITSVEVAWLLASLLVAFRLLFNGVVVAHYRSEKVTFRAMLSGLMLAIVTVAVAVLKAYLVH